MTHMTIKEQMIILRKWIALMGCTAFINADGKSVSWYWRDDDKLYTASSFTEAKEKLGVR